MLLRAPRVCACSPDDAVRCELLSAISLA
jgi:hypothetical protein